MANLLWTLTTLACIVHHATSSTITLTSPIPSLVIEDPCGSDTSFPSYSDEEYGNSAFPADGDFESINPVLGRLVNQFYQDPFTLALVCSTSSPNVVPESFAPIANESVISELCNTAAITLGPLPGSTQFVHSFTADSGLFTPLSIVFLDPDLRA